MKKLLVRELLRSSLSLPPKQFMATLAGVQLNILEWGDKSKPGILFLHGGAAHAGWWRFIAPFFLPDYHCIAMDFSGHGDSARRSIYKPLMWGEEVSALINKTSIFSEPPVVVGHSMGGLIGIRTAASGAAALSGLVIIDSSVRPRQEGHHNEANKKKKRGANIFAKKRLYESRKKALEKFRLIPPQVCKNKVLLDFIAEESIFQAEDGWTWKFDPLAFRDLQPVSLFDQLKEISCPTAIIYGEHSRILDKKTAMEMSQQIPNALDIVEIPDAHHHIILDQPEMLIEEVRFILSFCYR